MTMISCVVIHQVRDTTFGILCRAENFSTFRATDEVVFVDPKPFWLLKADPVFQDENRRKLVTAGIAVHESGKLR